MISLGCAKNLVDAEVMMGSLMKQGFQITNENAEADALIVNTCSFIDAAQEESVDTILESTEFREQANTGQAVIVSGCLSQRYRKELPKLMPEVDAFMGIDQVEEVGEIVRQAVVNRGSRLVNADGLPGQDSGETKQAVAKLTADDDEQPAIVDEPLVEIHARPDYIPKFETPRFRLTPNHFAYVKIAEGCNHPCSFCIIPRMRGSHRSRTQADILQEARQLVADGVKELNLISQDSTYYGLDLRENHRANIASPERFTAAANELPTDASTLASLLRGLNAIEGEFWIRILYTHPAHWTEEIISAIAECEKVVKYVDMPLQHIHDAMLERMRRETSGQYIRDLIGRIREGIPGIAIRTTFIVGFPGETDQDFEMLLDFLRQAELDRVGCFEYSAVDGAAANSIDGFVPDDVKHERWEALMALQAEVSARRLAAKVGAEMTVLVDAVDDGLAAARSSADAPEIDGLVHIQHAEGISVGDWVRVKIVGSDEYDLFAETVQ